MQSAGSFRLTRLFYFSTINHTHQNNRSKRHVFSALLACFSIAACGPTTTLSITEVLAYDFCETLEKPVSWVGLDELSRIRGTAVVAGELAPPEQATVYLALYNGQHPTPGFAFELTEARVDEDVLTLVLHWRKPQEDKLIAQVISTPCLIIGLSPAGQVSQVEARLDGAPFGQLSAPSLTQ